jgi:hypothetical protein
VVLNLVETQILRLLRTSSSERFLLRRYTTDVAALDIHYLSDGTVQATLVVFENAGIKDEELPQLLGWIDEVLLPQVSLENHKLTFTVVMGRVVGAYMPDTEVASPASV